jgi:hypothetical protein
MSYTLLNYELQLVCNIAPELSNNGVPIEYNPQSKYLNYKHLPLHAYGKGTFCRFGIPNFLHKTGVYMVLVNEQPKYVGECEDLENVGTWAMEIFLHETASKVDNQPIAE